MSYQISFENYQRTWPENKVKLKLEAIANSGADVRWLQRGCQIRKPGLLGRILWIFAQFFEGLRIRFYGVNYHYSRAVLLDLRHQIQGRADLEILYDRAVKNYNLYIPARYKLAAFHVDPVVYRQPASGPSVHMHQVPGTGYAVPISTFNDPSLGFGAHPAPVPSTPVYFPPTPAPAHHLHQVPGSGQFVAVSSNSHNPMHHAVADGHRRPGSPRHHAHSELHQVPGTDSYVATQSSRTHSAARHSETPVHVVPDGPRLVPGTDNYVTPRHSPASMGFARGEETRHTSGDFSSSRGNAGPVGVGDRVTPRSR